MGGCTVDVKMDQTVNGYVDGRWMDTLINRCGLLEKRVVYRWMDVGL